LSIVGPGAAADLSVETRTQGGAAVRRTYRIVALLGGLAAAGSLGGCNDDPPPAAPPTAKTAPAAPSKITVDPAPKDMKPAEAKAPEAKSSASKTVDELPPLVPPAGGKEDPPK
jgi:hypothetical protein